MAKEKYGRVVYCNAITSGPLWRGREEAGGTGEDEVVLTGGNWPDGENGDGSFSGKGGQEWAGGLKEED